jgi:hypothetical protein
MNRLLETTAFLALLSGLALLDVHVATSPLETTPVAPPAAGASVATSTGMAGNAVRFRLDGIAPESFTETLERPLFWPSRRPAVGAKPEVAVPSVPTETSGDLRLAGVMSGGRGRARALIVSPQFPAGRWLEVGGEIDGWRLTRIENAVVSLEAAGRRQELRLQ